MFERNQRICLISDTQRRGYVNDIPTENVYEIIWDNGDIETLRENDIQNEIINKTPWEKLAENKFDNIENFTISSIVNKVRNTSANTISTLKASKTIFKPYQFIPLLKLLNSEKKRIIVADEVGLGKTISAGHIVLELAARGNLNSLLVVCLNSIQYKWMDELLNKFNVRVKKFESVGDFKKSLENFQKHGDKIFGVINYDKFRQSKNIEYFQNNAIGFDLIICDEAHTLRNDTNARKSLKAFTELANSIVMLTATPIMTSLENLYSLVKLIDDENYSNYQVFHNAININKPFIRAYNQLNEGITTRQISAELKSSEVQNIFKYGDGEYITNDSLNNVLSEDGLYKSIINELETDEKITVQKKVRLQEMLINLNSLNHFYTRTRKRGVLTEGNIVQRNANVVEIEMNEEEKQIYNKVIAELSNDIGGIQTERKHTSSLYANKHTEKEYDKGIASLSYNDSKYFALIDIINRQQGSRIIIFSTFRSPLLYLKNRLQNDGFNVELIFGSVDMKERNKILDNFEKNQFQILLSSEVGSTGLDMQFCNRMVNYDLPWNPMVIEQRIGRIDRIGQQSNVINIFNFIYKNTIEEQIYYRLFDRIGLFRESLGNLDEILGEKEMYIQGEIEKIYKENLTEEQKKDRLDRIATAFEKNKLDLRNINEGLKDSFSNDLYFENEIIAIEKNKQYLTENDLVEFIQRIITNELTTLTLVKTKENSLVYHITQPREDLIFDFIQKNYDSNNTELVNIFKAFKIHNWNKIIKCTFSQEFAFNNKNVEYISAYHPLINAISNYFHKEKLDRNTVFRFALNRNEILDSDFKKKYKNGFYFLAYYDLDINKTLYGKTSKFSHINSLVIDLNGESFFAFSKEDNDLFSSICQQHKTIIPENAIVIFNNDLMSELKKIYTDFVLNEKLSLEKNEKLKFDSELARKTSQEISDIDKQIERREIYISEKKGIENILKAEIKELEKRKENLELLSINASISIENKLTSLNFVYLYE